MFGSLRCLFQLLKLGLQILELLFVALWLRGQSNGTAYPVATVVPKAIF